MGVIMPRFKSEGSGQGTSLVDPFKDPDFQRFVRERGLSPELVMNLALVGSGQEPQTRGSYEVSPAQLAESAYLAGFLAQGVRSNEFTGRSAVKLPERATKAFMGGVSLSSGKFTIRVHPGPKKMIGQAQKRGVLPKPRKKHGKYVRAAKDHQKGPSAKGTEAVNVSLEITF